MLENIPSNTNKWFNILQMLMMIVPLLCSASCKSAPNNTTVNKEEIADDHIKGNQGAISHKTTAPYPAVVRESVPKLKKHKSVKKIEINKPVSKQLSNHNSEIKRENLKPTKEDITIALQKKDNKNGKTSKSSNTKQGTKVENSSPISEKPERPTKITAHTIVSAPNHKKWDELLRNYVSIDGKVNYKGLKTEEKKLDEYLSILESAQGIKNWTRDDQLSFWINAYNAFTVKMIVSNYPVASITKLEGGKPWDKKWINIEGESISLNDIENNIIRPSFNEPRIHFAVNCAAKSCPPLLNEAFMSQTLDSQLEKQTKDFINNRQFNTLKKSKIEVSKIFEWYGNDFGNVVKFIQRYAPHVTSDAKLTFKEYNWDLNE